MTGKAAFGRVASGLFVETYDFGVFLFFATYVAAAFFPADSQSVSLLITLATFGAASLVRPIGALVLGSYADRRGRRPGLLMSLTLMTIGALVLAVTPPYATIGIVAPVLVVAARLLQGFAVGVEQGGVTAYLLEIAPPGKSGFYCGGIGVPLGAALMVTAGIGAGLTLLLTGEQMAAWGWRVPFLIGCALIPVLLWQRRSLAETDAFLDSRPAPTQRAFLRILGQHWPSVALYVAMGIFPIVAFLLATFYVPTYATAILGLPPLESLLVTMCVGLALLVWLPCCGALSDRIGRWPPIIVALVLALATSYPAMAWLAAEPTIARLLLVDLWIILLNGLYFGAMAPLYAEALPITIRTSGLAIVFSLSNGIFGTLTPVISTYLIAITSNRAAPAIWLSAVAAVGLIAAAAARLLASGSFREKQEIECA